MQLYYWFHPKLTITLYYTFSITTPLTAAFLLSALFAVIRLQADHQLSRCLHLNCEDHIGFGKKALALPCSAIYLLSRPAPAFKSRIRASGLFNTGDKKSSHVEST
jgi:hypothetical protein